MKWIYFLFIRTAYTKIHIFPPLCTVYNIAWRVYSIHSPPWVWGGKNWPEQHNIHPGAAHKKLDLYFLSWKKNLHTHHAIIHHFRIFTCFVNFFADLFIMLYYLSTKYHCLKNQLNTPSFWRRRKICRIYDL